MQRVAKHLFFRPAHDSTRTLAPVSYSTGCICGDDGIIYSTVEHQAVIGFDMGDACSELGVFLAKDIQLGRDVIGGQMAYLKGFVVSSQNTGASES